MEEVKSKGKLKGFTNAILSAAQAKAEAVRAEADEHEKASIAEYRERSKAEGAR